jgi:hypothetical protein
MKADTNDTELAVIRTLTYRDLFDYPLREEEVFRFLIGKKATKGDVRRVLKDLLARGMAGEDSGYYFPPGRDEVVDLRKIREKISSQKFAKALRYAHLVGKIPWAKGVFLTGATAAGNASEEGDLDFLIIAADRRVWLTRLLVYLFLIVLRAKRPRGARGGFGDKVCPNMFLSEKTLIIPEAERNLYSAHEVVQTRPLWESEPVHRRFLAANDWVVEFFPNLELPKLKDANGSDLGRTGSPSRIFDLFEWVAYRLQLLYLSRHRTREVCDPDRILFHPRDWAAEVLPKLEDRTSG